MLALYLFCLVLGGGFLAASVVGDAFDGAGDVELDVDVDVDAGGGGDAAAKIFSLRGLVYGLFGFGAVGTALTLSTPGLVAPIRLLLAVAGGLTSGTLITVLFNWLKATESGDLESDDAFVGLSGTVTLPLTTGTAGTVAVERGARRYTLRALPHVTEGGDPGTWSTVVVVDMKDGVARVAPVDDELTLEP